MNILIIDVGGAGLDFALRCQQHGHKVRMFIRKTKEGLPNHIGDGLVQKVPEWEPHMKWADLVFLTDNIYYLHALEQYRRKGFPILGPSLDAAELELDRDRGQQALKRCGIDVMSSVEFTDYDTAIKFVKENPKRYVSKPSGDADKALSYVSKSAADLIFMLQYWKKHQKIKAPFILQPFKKGIEMAVGGWFGPGGWSKYWLENFEHKKFMVGDLGVNTGEMGTAIKYVTESQLAQEMLVPLTDYLHGLNYTGFLDVSVIIDAQGNPWPLEFTCRPGWPLFQIQQALHKGDPAEWMVDLLNGQDTLKVSSDIALGVVCAIPDFPYTTLTKKEVSGYPLYGVNLEEPHPNVHLVEVMKGKAPAMEGKEVKDKDMFVSAGDYLLVTTGTGKTVLDAKERAYDVMDSIEIPNSPMYRTDIGDRLEKQLPELQEHGYAESWEFE